MTWRLKQRDQQDRQQSCARQHHHLPARLMFRRAELNRRYYRGCLQHGLHHVLSLRLLEADDHRGTTARMTMIRHLMRMTLSLPARQVHHKVQKAATNVTAHLFQLDLSLRLRLIKQDKLFKLENKVVNVIWVI